jgi:hypothetical protein
MDKKLFQEACAKYDGDTEQFRNLLSQVLSTSESLNDLAHKFQVMPSLIIKWANGSATPWHMIRRQVVKHLAYLMGE